MNINESKVINNLIAYVETNNLGEELKNNIIKLDRNDPMIIINAIHAYYDWKEERSRNDVVNSKRNKTDNNNNSRYEDVVNWELMIRVKKLTTSTTVLGNNDRYQKI